MKNFEKWTYYIKESELIEFPLKKYLSIIKDKLNLNKQNQHIKLDFDSIYVNIYIDYNKTDDVNYNGKTDILTALKDEFKSFNVYIEIDDIIINERLTLSLIQHELKHIYDLLFDESKENTFLKIKPINILKNKYEYLKEFYYFIHLVYESLEHELKARNSMIYERFRWLKNYDKQLIKNEFKNTYIYKSLINMSNFNTNQFIEQFTLNQLINITNDFILIYGDGDYGYKINNKNELFDFYNYWEKYFKSMSKEYLEKAYKIIDELIKDSRPYVESVLTTQHLNIKYNHKNLFNKKTMDFFVK